MMNDDMLRNIEYLREKADVSYEEAERLLEENGGNVMRVLVELEKQGRVYANGHEQTTYSRPHQSDCNANDAKEKATSFINKAFQTRLVVEKKRDGGKKETVANVNVPFAVGAAICAPYLAAAIAALAFATGHNVRIAHETPKKDEDDEI